MSERRNEENKGVLRLCLRLCRYALRRWPGLLGLLATMLLKTGLDVLKPWPMKILVDNVLGGRPLPDVVSRLASPVGLALTRDTLLLVSVGGTVVLFLAGWAVGVASSYANIGFGQRMVYDLASDLFAHLQRLSLRFHSRKPVGDSIRRVTVDSGCVSTIVKDALLPVLGSLLNLAAMFAIMWQLDTTLTLLALLVVPPMVLVFKLYANSMVERGYVQQDAEGHMYDVLEHTLSAMPVVQAFGGQERADSTFKGWIDKTLGATMATTGVQMQFKVLTGLSTALGTALVLWVGADHVLHGSLSLGSVLVFVSYLGSLYGPLESLMYTSSTINGAAGSAQRVMEILDTEEEVKDKAGAHLLPAPSRGLIRYEDITFGYERGQEPVLRNVSLEVQPGETVAIIGPTGAGKTTLVSLLPRFFDTWSGKVTVDGVDVRDLQLRSLRENIALVLQEPFLFPLSIADNIAYSKPHASRDEIEMASRAANAHDFITKLPDGYDTLIGERGATLSGGEKQRISIARALLKDAPILILDEPTSSLDAQTEGLLMQALHTLMEGRSTLIIAHRLSTIRGADRIVVVHDHTIQEVGTHLQLLQKGGIYARLHELQFGGNRGVRTESALRERAG